MARHYSEPELEVRKYAIASDIFTDSNPNQGGGLIDDDEGELGGNGAGSRADLFGDLG